MILYAKGHKFFYELEKLCTVFFPNEKIEGVEYKNQNLTPPYVYTEVCDLHNKRNLIVHVAINDNFLEDNRILNSDVYEIDDTTEKVLAQMIFKLLKKITGQEPSWGILTGIRPVKLMRRLINEMGSDEAIKYFNNEFMVSEEKTNLCYNTALKQQSIIDLSSNRSFSLYIAIPFCPTRCSYCSFVSQSIEKSAKLIPEYLDCLIKEIEYTSSIVEKLGLKLETVYIGGGTPTTLSANQLEILINKINENFNVNDCREFTVEAGRPDTITEDKLLVLKKLGVTRISINPQTLNDNVLELIGRKHTAKQTVDAFYLARKCGFDNINMDLIAGLPGDEYNSFKNTINEVCKLNPENITIHTLAMKRSSRLTDQGNKLDKESAKLTEKMMEFAKEILFSEEYIPYYLYRQSKMLGNLENIGFCKKGYENLYNVYIMEETHTIISCGASGVTKLKAPNGDFIERCFNFKFPYEYIQRFSEIINRKDKVLSFYDDFKKLL